MIKVEIKRLNENIKIPSYQKEGDAGVDLTSTGRFFDKYGNVVYTTGIAIKIPDDYVGFIFPRSSNSKKDLILSNSVGVIDSGYTGEILFKFKPSVIYTDDVDGPSIDTLNFDRIIVPDSEYGVNLYEVGDRIGQLIIIPYPRIEWIEVDELPKTERGQNGFGSTDIY